MFKTTVASVLLALGASSIATLATGSSIFEEIPDLYDTKWGSGTAYFDFSNIPAITETKADNFGGGGCVLVMYFWKFDSASESKYSAVMDTFKHDSSSANDPWYGWNGIAPWCVDSQATEDADYLDEANGGFIYDSVLPKDAPGDSIYLIFKGLNREGVYTPSAIKATDVTILVDSPQESRAMDMGKRLKDHWARALLPNPYTEGKAKKPFGIRPDEVAIGFGSQIVIKDS